MALLTDLVRFPTEEEKRKKEVSKAGLKATKRFQEQPQYGSKVAGIASEIQGKEMPAKRGLKSLFSEELTSSGLAQEALKIDDEIKLEQKQDAVGVMSLAKFFIAQGNMTSAVNTLKSERDTLNKGFGVDLKDEDINDESMANLTAATDILSGLNMEANPETGEPNIPTEVTESVRGQADLLDAYKLLKKAGPIGDGMAKKIEEVLFAKEVDTTPKTIEAALISPEAEVRERGKEAGEIKAGFKKEGDKDATKLTDEIASGLYSKSYYELDSTQQQEVLKYRRRTNETNTQWALRLSKRFESLQEVKGYKKARGQSKVMERIYDKYLGKLEGMTDAKKIESLGNATDQALIMTFNKILDPDSVVRESEYARYGIGMSMANRIEAFYKRQLEGGTLTDAERNGLVQAALTMEEAIRQEAMISVEDFRGMADEMGLNRKLIIPRSFRELKMPIQKTEKPKLVIN